MKKFIFCLLLPLLLAAGAAAYLMYCRPDTPAGAWVKAQYDRFFPAAADGETVGAAAETEEVAVASPEGEPPASAADLPSEPAADLPSAPAEEPRKAPAPPAVSVPAAADAPSVPERPKKPFAKENWYAGKKLTADDVRGKTVLVCLFDVADARSVAMLGRVQKTWEAFGHKPFTVIGSHRGARSAKVVKALRKEKVTFSVYQDAYLPCEPAKIDATSYFYVVKPDGKLGYRGLSDLEATEAVVNILSNSIGR